VLKVAWRASHKLSGIRYSWLSYLMASTAGNLHLLIQLINSHGLWLLFMTSWIFKSKKDLLVFLMTFLNFFQSSRLLVILYMLRDLLHSLFYHCLECFVNLDRFAFLFQAWSISELRWLTVFEVDLVSDIGCVKILKDQSQLFDKSSFLFAIWLNW